MNFPEITNTDLALHSLLDQFELSAHAFDSITGTYYWDGTGIDFMVDTPVKRVQGHAIKFKAKKIYLAHTHPLSVDESITFYNSRVDPREKIAYGLLALPIGNGPSKGDIEYFENVKKEFRQKNIEAIGVIYAASGIWEFDLKPNFRLNDFLKEYEIAFPTSDNENFTREWTSKHTFPSYFLELLNPKIHDTTYKTHHLKLSTPYPGAMQRNKATKKALAFYNSNGLDVKFHQYSEFAINPYELMREKITSWGNLFNK
ncbi:MAG TPA: hypothetical protein VLG47_00990 [Candidatus Saccharimonadales bacterium]|nr:hypothetical protein [Candidatus Saccharimonadales bacterium]